jgi:hypothetical protein
VRCGAVEGALQDQEGRPHHDGFGPPIREDNVSFGHTLNGRAEISRRAVAELLGHAGLTAIYLQKVAPIRSTEQCSTSAMHLQRSNARSAMSS